MRFWISWMVSIILLTSAVVDLVPRPLTVPTTPASAQSLSSQSLPSQSPATHSVICHCRACSSGNSCCCTKAKSALHAVVMRAHCDSPLTTPQLAKILFPAILVSFALDLHVALVGRVFPRLICRLHPRTLPSLLIPPRSFNAAFPL